jgi:Fe2+ or Zn2+ uptake regulation protein
MKHANAEINSLGLTKQREVVLQVVRSAEHHLTANEIFDEAKRLLPTISFATVYNSLSYLKKAGHIAEIQFRQNAARAHDVLLGHAALPRRTELPAAAD